MKNANDPVVIGYCAACGHPVYSNDDYYISGDEMIHASGVGAIARTVETGKSIYMSCLFLHLQQELMEEETAKLFGIACVRKGEVQYV